MAFILTAGLVNTWELLDKLGSFDSIADGGSEIPLSYGFKILVFGIMVGSVNYLGGQLIQTYQETILKLVSFFPISSLYTSKTITTNTIDEGGYGTTTKTYQKYKE